MRFFRSICAGAALATLAPCWTASAFAADAPIEPVKVTAVAYFDFNAAALRTEDKPALLQDVGKMQHVTWQSVTTTGHTDSVGSAAGNARLANRRARAVKAYLIAKGIDPSLIRTEARASGAPVADNATPQGRAKNRRAEVIFEGVRAP